MEEYKDEICFEVDTDIYIIRAIETRTKCFPPMGYEMNIDVAYIKIKGLLEKPIDKSSTRYVALEEVKKKIKIGILIPKAIKEKRRMINTLSEKFDNFLDEEVVEWLEDKEKKTRVKRETPSPIGVKPSNRSTSTLKEKKKADVELVKTKTYIRENKANGKPRRKLKLPKESDIESYDLPQFKVVLKVKILDDFIKTLKKYEGYSILKWLKYEKRNNEEKIKIEETVIAILKKFKKAPVEVVPIIEGEIYHKIDARWKYSLVFEK